MVTLTLSGCKIKNNSLRGYCKMNNNLLSNENFVNRVTEIAQQTFGQSIYFSKQVKNNSLNKEKTLMMELDTSLKNYNLTKDEKVKLESIKNQINKNIF